MTATDSLSKALRDRYLIERELGRGGMATVYLARDLKHHRQVALKVLRPELAAMVGPERFLREIQVTARLQHPSILPLFDSDRVNGSVFYVMPYVEGESLRQRLEREKQIPIETALEITRAVGSALEYAHRHDVIHRDVKPENILLHEGRALVADFGVAFAVGARGDARLTETGMSLGTPQYMSPEQVGGERQITARSDIYALGCVLYEMLVGEPPFTGPTAQSIVAKALTEKPQRLRPHRDTVPPHVETAVLKALAKLPADRFATMLDFLTALERPSSTSATIDLGAREVDGRGSRRRDTLLRFVGRPAVWLPLIASLAAIVFLQTNRSRSPESNPLQVTRFAITFPRDNMQPGLGLALSADGQVLVGQAGSGLYSRRMDALQPVPIDGTEGAVNPFLSPDGRWVAFSTDQKLKKVPLGGGTPIVLADAFQGNGTWGDDGTIIYKPTNPSFGGGLWRVSASGGSPTALTRPDSSKGEQGHYWPQMLPGGQAVLFTAYSTSTRTRIDLLSLANGKRKTLVEGGHFGRYVPTGHLLFVRAGALLVVPFDLARAEVTGEPIPLLEDVAVGGGGRAGYAVSRNGVLAYIPASALARQLVWVDRAGREEPMLDSLAEYSTPRISPDGKRIALAIGPKYDIWIYEIGRRLLSRLTRLEEGNAMAPLWSADGERVIYSGQSPAYDLFWRAADGSTPEEKLVASPQDKWATSVSPDGKTIAFGTRDLEILQLGRQLSRQVLTRTPFVEGSASWSPDGRWLTYASNESGRFEVYLGPASNPTASRRQVSTGGGLYPRWGAAGREILYFSDFTRGRLMSASFDPGTGKVGTPMLLFQGSYEPGIYAAQGYDVTPDGRRFIMVKYNVAAREVRVILNWPQELERRERP